MVGINRNYKNYNFTPNMKVGVATIIMHVHSFRTHLEPTFGRRTPASETDYDQDKKILQNVAIFLNCVAICLSLP